MDTIARFITVRNPAKPARAEMKAGFITYDPALAASLADEASADEDAVRRRAVTYANGQEFARTLTELRDRSAALYDLGELLELRRDGVTKKDLDAFVKDHDVVDDPATVAWLWDNLVAHWFADGPTEVRDAIIWMLRAARVAEHIDDKNLEDLGTWATATVVVPSAGGAVPGEEDDDGDDGDGPTEPEFEETTPELSPEAEKRAQAFERISAIEAAGEELRQLHRREVERQRTGEIAPPFVPSLNAQGVMELPEEAAPAPPAGKSARSARQGPAMIEGAAFDAQVLESARPETRELIRDLDLGSDARIPFVLQRLQQEAATEARSVVLGAKAAKRVVRIGGALFAQSSQAMMMSKAMKPKPHFGDHPGQDIKKCQVRPLGIADFRRVEQRLCCYEPGEVAHIENVLIGESKERSTRRLRRSEDTLSVTTVDETSEERDSQTTNRFEVQKESENVMNFDLSFEAGVNVAGSYGVMKIEADARFATSFSTQQSDRKATKYAQEVTERAVERIASSVREERITRVIEEFEETNKHGLDNAKGTKHIVGLYRWLDKVYEARVVNYGKRTMYEFLVPEPAAFHMHAKFNASSEDTDGLEKPLDPRTQEFEDETGLTKLVTHETITEWNYAGYAAAFDAEVDPPPAPMITISKAYHREGMDHTVQFAESKNDMQIQPGYEAQRFDALYGLHSEPHSGGLNWITIAIGRWSQFDTVGGSFWNTLHGEDTVVPIVIMGRTRFFAVNVEVICDRTPTALTEWKIKTFAAVIAAYNEKLAAYNNALAEARAMAGVVIEGDNPARNRETERTELRKASIRLLSKYCNPLWSDAMHDDGECDYPEFDCCEAMKDGAYAAFVEQAFEWSLMTYLFYPYYWGRKCNWEKIYQLSDMDPLFLNFLQAGYARVVVPVREGYEAAALAFVKEGKIWDGAEVPVIGDPLYLAIVNEMKTAVGIVDPKIEPWQVRVPTTLVALQCESGCIPGSGLPCPCNDDDETPNP